MDLPGDICKICNNKCTESGEDSKAIQCEICYAWVHATCDGMSSEQYDLFNQLSAAREMLADTSRRLGRVKTVSSDDNLHS